MMLVKRKIPDFTIGNFGVFLEITKLVHECTFLAVTAVGCRLAANFALR